MPIHAYTNWNVRSTDKLDQIEPFRKYFFICEGANTETFYFKKLIDLRKQLDIHPQIDIRLMEKTGEDHDISYPKKLLEFAEKQKDNPTLEFDKDHDKMILVFDADIFEEKVSGYDELIQTAEEHNLVGVTNPGFEVFLLLHISGFYENYVLGHEEQFLSKDDRGRFRYPYELLLNLTGMNAKRNPRIGELAENILVAIDQEKNINSNIHDVKGKLTSNLASIIEMIIKDKPKKI